jgi:putative endonuclease
VYLIRRGDGALYAGITTDLERRLAEHRSGLSRSARSLRGRGPLELVYHAPVGLRATALRVEHRIKRLDKPGKEILVHRQPGTRSLLRTLGLSA